MPEFFKVIKYEEALGCIKDNLPRPASGKIKINEAWNKVLAKDIICPEDMPPFDRSTVDGYAVIAKDTFGASESMPAFLQYIGEIKMGEKADLALEEGKCVWIPTGGMLPLNANAVVMVEYTEKLGEDTVLINRPVAPLENIIQKGEDARKGQELFKKGKFLRPQDIGFLASLGIAEVEVFMPYRVGIISTGDEIIPVEEKPDGAKIRDVNSYSLAAAVLACSCAARNYPIVRDNFNELKACLNVALRENDIVLISGGSSVGVMDVTLQVLKSFPEVKLLFHGLAVKPGKPTMGARIGGKLVVGLPGHPVSALTIFYVLLKPLLSGSQAVKTEAVLQANISSQAGRDDFIPVVLRDNDGVLEAWPLLGKSGMMSILAMADGYLHIPYEKQGLLKGEKIEVIIF
ncbi:molybdopterin molybdochelatase [Thermosyntropha lipolytica DSM 11003]|uniref:Molybdopterin molybdenumtransferase n=1 Tax=Thermosyntropha lipolytica DSM 11003 TaxID=1123382 RepID=A0A1M5RUL3_9FIRM|nr:gephyrin-like molybdotransferase Glp [Thermosyntropha lipolytica]SHH29728.1 molybdopterin molybdochelatase [Thermosyntropha lipolytica DSM 11003]